jgi:cytochrome c oxidase cbb3-type subunit 3
MSGFWSTYIIVITLVTIGALLLLTVPALPGRQREWPDDDTTGVTWDEDIKELRNPTPEWWLAVYYAALFFAVVYMLIFGMGNFRGAMGWSSAKQYEREVAAAQERFGNVIDELGEKNLMDLVADEYAMQVGANLFAENCAVCHGAGGGGGQGFPNLTNDDWLWGGEPDQILISILQGRNGMMPPQGPVLGDNLDAVVAYVRQLSGQSADAALAAQGEKSFTTICAACHGPDGTGNVLLGAPNLADDIWLYGGSTPAIRETLMNGRAGVMPAHADTLGEARSRILAAYTYGLSQSDPGGGDE